MKQKGRIVMIAVRLTPGQIRLVQALLEQRHNTLVSQALVTNQWRYQQSECRRLIDKLQEHLDIQSR